MSEEVPVRGGAPMQAPEPSLGSAAVVLICDRNYLLPTLASALSADRHVRDAPVFIFVVDADAAWAGQFDAAVRGTKIAIRPAPLPELGALAMHHRDRYLPPIALARFWLDDLLDEGFDRFLYLDGDTMVDAELDSLLATAPPAEGLMASADFIPVFVDELGVRKRQDLAYLKGLGCQAASYFNSGVIYAARSAWREIAPAAMRFLAEHPELCRSSDQSALNHASRGKVTLLSLRYNYQSDHMMVLDPRREGIQPVVWHFTGGPKPWDLPGWPWGEHFNQFYRMAQDRLADCDLQAPVPPEAQIAAGIAHRRRARTRLTWVYPWRRWRRRLKILRMLEVA